MFTAAALRTTGEEAESQMNEGDLFIEVRSFNSGCLFQGLTGRVSDNGEGHLGTALPKERLLPRKRHGGGYKCVDGMLGFL